MRYTMISMISSVAFFVLVFFVAGCQNNIRLYYKNNIFADGEIKTKDEAYYHYIEIRTPLKPVSEKNSFLIEFNDGKKLLLSESLSQKDISSLASSSDMNDTWEGHQIETYYIDDCRFAFYEGQLVSIKVISFIPPTKNISLKIGNYEKKIFYKMPLTQKQLFEIFGTPDKLQDIHRW